VHHAHDVIELLAIHRQPRMPLGAELLQRLIERDIDPHRHDVGPRHHHIIGRGLAQAQDVGNQRAFLAIQLRLLAGAYSFEAAITRHAHEYQL
jgi:hypothetical protein